MFTAAVHCSLHCLFCNIHNRLRSYVCQFVCLSPRINYTGKTESDKVFHSESLLNFIGVFKKHEKPNRLLYSRRSEMKNYLKRKEKERNKRNKINFNENTLNFRYSGILHSINWYFATDVSGKKLLVPSSRLKHSKTIPLGLLDPSRWD